MGQQLKAAKSPAPSMHDVARAAGVSQTTVSFVINNTVGTNIPEETRERVLAAVKDLNYRPNAMARGLRSRRSHTIGFISDAIATTPFAGKTIQGAQEVAWTNGQLLLVINTAGDAVLETAAVEMLLERQVEGIIYATMYHRSVTPPPQIAQVPAVLLDCFVADGSLPSVVPDEVQGGQTATEALLRAGHRRIGYISNTDLIPATAGRLKGYQLALEAYSVPFDPGLIMPASGEVGAATVAAQLLMQLPDPPTALFCFNDIRALEAYQLVRKLGLTIPEDVAVVGFDNQEMIASHLDPPLSTVELPHLAMGRWAVEYLIQSAGLPASPVHKLMPCPYIPRHSV